MAVPDKHDEIIDKICEESGIVYRTQSGSIVLSKKEAQQILAFIQTLKTLSKRREEQ